MPGFLPLLVVCLALPSDVNTATTHRSRGCISHPAPPPPDTTGSQDVPIILQAEAPWKREINRIWDEGALWAVAWKHAWTGNALRLVICMQDTAAYQERQKRQPHCRWGHGEDNDPGTSMGIGSPSE